jgi:diguanylate cyclase (GGDEF)-like protein
MANVLKPAPEINILIVDDTPDNLRLLDKILEPHGYFVRKSLSGRMAIQGIHRDPPDLILLDITMPEMNGYEVCQYLKTTEATAAIPIIFISALDHINDKARAFEMGAQDYIAKPFQELEVLMRVNNQLLLQQQRQQLIQHTQRLDQEIQERLKAEAEIRQLSLTDQLTGLHTRRGFLLLAEQQLKIAQHTQSPCCFLVADIDGFTQINDSLGHDVGDRAIVDAAHLLKQTFRDSDIIARLEGDQFAILIPVQTDNAEDCHARLQANIDSFNQTRDRPYQLSMRMSTQVFAALETGSVEQALMQAFQ